jgi:hypothetical protein
MTRKPGGQPGRTVKRTPATPARGRAKQPPRLSLVTSSLDILAPEDCSVSLILKEASHDTDGRYYKMWLAVGRSDQDALSVHYKHNGESAVRCDVPVGMDFSPAALQPYLEKFLAEQHEQPGGPGNIEF